MPTPVVSAVAAHETVPARNERTFRYEIAFGERVAGHVVLVRHGDGSSDEDLEFDDRGHGPMTHAQLRLGSDGMPDHFELTGHDDKGREVHERLNCDAARCAWQGGDGQGEGPRAFYVPFHRSLIVNGPLLRLATQAPGARLLPGGIRHARQVADATLVLAGQSLRVGAYQLSGSSFTPWFEWYDENAEFFAQVDDFGAVIRAGYRASIAELLEKQRPLAGKWREQIATRVAHRPAKLAIMHARVFDPATRSTLDDATLVIESGKIAGVGARLSVDDKAELIDASGKTVLPGLWDMHVHLNDDDGLMNIANGVTSVRDLGSEMAAALARKTRWDSGKELGPRVVLAGFVDGHGPEQGPTGVFADTPEEAVAAVDSYADNGYVQIKIYDSVRPDLVPVIVNRARTRGLRVSGHVPRGMTTRSVVNAEFQELQHVEYLLFDLQGAPGESRRRTTSLAERGADIDFNGERTQALIDLLVKRRTVVDTTLNVLEGELTVRRDRPSPTVAAMLERLPLQVRRYAVSGALPVPEGMDARYQASFRRCVEFVKLLWDRGVPLVAGSDAWPGFALHRELELYSLAGIPNAEVLAIATLGAARVMKLDQQLGSLAPGKVADLIIVDGDPLTKMSDVRRVLTVVKGGMVIDAVATRQALSIQP